METGGGGSNGVPLPSPQHTYLPLRNSMSQDRAWCRYAVPCNVGESKMRYDLVERHYYWFSLVVSNTR